MSFSIKIAILLVGQNFGTQINTTNGTIISKMSRTIIIAAAAPPPLELFALSGYLGVTDCD